MSVYQLKTQFQDQLRPISDKLVTLGVTANQVTTSALFLSAGTAYLIATVPPQNSELSEERQGYSISANERIWWILPLSLFVRMALNAIDGMMAREHHQASKSGAILNEVGDIVSDSLLIGSLLAHLPVDKTSKRLSNNTHLYFINGLSTLTELIAITANLTTDQRANQGPLGKSDRALELGAIGTFMALGRPQILINNYCHPTIAYIRPLLFINELLLLKTCFNRLAYIADYCYQIHYKSYFEKWHPAPKLRYLTADFTSQSSENYSTPITISNNINSIAHSAIHTASLPSLQGRFVMSKPLNTDQTENLHSKQNKESTQQILDDQNKTELSVNTLNAEGATPKESVSDQLIPDTGKADHSTSIIAEQSCFNAYDGTALYYRYWLTMPLDKLTEQSQSTQKSEQQPTLKQVILLHRGHEHSGRLNELGERFAQAGYQVFAWDARGNGRSGGIKDHADSVTELERDLNDFVNLVIAQTGIAIEDTLIVASSIGAVLAAAWVHDYAPTIRGMILGTPALSIRLYIPFAIPALKMARKFGLMPRVSSYVKAQVLTHDKQAQAAYNADPLISGSISSDLLIDTHATGQRLLDDAGAITTPTFILCAGKDYVVDKQAEREFYEQLSSSHKRWQLYPDSFHAIFHETNKADIFSDCIEFANSLFHEDSKLVDLTAAHNNSASKDKVDRLAIKPFNPSFAITRFAMQKFGHVSDAIATGLEHGFDSGSSLDKVYENDPKGSNAFGKAVDKFYLSNIGWQGIRIRRQHILQLGRLALDQRLQADASKDKSIRILDIASGNGYYVFDLLAEYDALNAELRDYDSHNVQVLADKAEKLGFSARVKALKKDAFDSASYSANSRVSADSRVSTDNAKQSNNELFDVAISSGVFELFSDNTLVSTALKGIHESLADSGYLLYTNQPWHPEQEFISKTLNNHRGSSWVMRCRSQAEMDQLVTQAGFKKLDMRIDRFGIFTVSLAIKVA